MKIKNLIFVMLLFCFVLSNFSSATGYQIKNSDLFNFYSGSDIIIPDDYPTIQEGINYANSNDVVFVRNGIYKENIVINKTGLTLLGEDKYGTIIDGCNGVDDGIKIKSENVTIKNLTIKNFKNKQKQDIYSWNQAGIEIHESNAKIINNYFVDNGVGLELFSSIIN